jgi:hypothetical protein
MHGTWRGVETERWHVRRLSAIGRFLAGEARSPEESVATDAIGAIGWYGGLRVHDVHGLVDPAIAHAARLDARVGRGFAGHDRRDLARLLEYRPTFVMFTRELRAERPQRLAVPPELGPRFERDYALRSVWLEDPSNAAAGWWSYLERRDRGAAPAAAP